MYQKNSNQIERILYLCRILPRHHQTAFSIEQIKLRTYDYYNNDIEEKSINKTIRRDLKKLESLLTTGKMEVISGKGSQADKYYLSADASMEKFCPELALVLVMAREYLCQYLPYQVYDKVEGFFESAEQQLEKNTLLSDWQSRIRHVPSGYRSEVDSYFDSSEIRNIYTALLDNDGAWLKVLYRREGQFEQTEYTLKPHGIIQHGHKQYLIASKIIDNSSTLRTFNIQRFDQVELIEPRITVEINSYDMDCLVEEKEYESGYFERDELNIKLRCENYLLDELKSNPITSCQSINETNDGYFRLTAKCMITQSLLSWLIEKAHSVQVQEPQELFEKVQTHIYAAMNNYDMEFDDIEDSEHLLPSLELLDVDHAVDILSDWEDEELTNEVSVDTLFEEFVAFILHEQVVSINALKTKFGIGYNRAARIIDMMEEKGIVSEMSEYGHRKILI